MRFANAQIWYTDLLSSVGPCSENVEAQILQARKISTIQYIEENS